MTGIHVLIPHSNPNDLLLKPPPVLRTSARLAGARTIHPAPPVPEKHSQRRNVQQRV
jgi:hypothetical protein